MSAALPEGGEGGGCPGGGEGGGTHPGVRGEGGITIAQLGAATLSSLFVPPPPLPRQGSCRGRQVLPGQRSAPGSGTALRRSVCRAAKVGGRRARTIHCGYQGVCSRGLGLGFACTHGGQQSASKRFKYARPLHCRHSLHIPLLSSPCRCLASAPVRCCSSTPACRSRAPMTHSATQHDEPSTS